MKKDLPSHIYRKKGVLYFQKRVGTGWIVRKLKTQFAEGDQIPDALYDERKELLDRPKIEPRRTWKQLIAHYHTLPAYHDKAERTRLDYDKVTDFLIDRMGGIDPAKMTRPHVIKLRDSNAHRRRFANYCVQIVRILQEVARDLGWRTDNPAKGVKLIPSPKGTEREAWPAEKVKAMREEFALGTPERLLFEMLLGTGQRIGDVLKAKWSDLDRGGINVAQGKTDQKLWLPLTGNLHAALKASARTSIFICPNPHSHGQWKYHRAAQTMLAARRRIGAEAWDQHALRYTATAELAAAGCTDEQIMAVTGHKSVAMVRHYAGPARQIARAETAISRRENKTKPEQEC